MTDALREALERCPFCGSTDVVVHDNGRGLIFNVHCNNCHATGPWERCAADAPHSWNKREALSAPVVSEPWQPIETAPLNEMVLAWCPKHRLVLMERHDGRATETWAVSPSGRMDCPEPLYWQPLREPPAAIEAMSLAKRNADTE